MPNWRQESFLRPSLMSQLADLIETMARPALLGLAGKTIEKRTRKELTSYFRALKLEILSLNPGNMLKMGMSGDLARHAAVLRLSVAVRRHRDLLKEVLATNMTAAMLVADKTHPFAEATSAIGTDTAAIDVATSITSQLAAAWAAENAAEAVTGIDETTINLIADAVVKGIEDNLGVEGTARLIASVLDDMAAYGGRAYMIARTELNSAFSQAALMKLEALGIQYKRWILGPNPCEICEDNADEGVIGVDEEFPSGDMAPPAHPNCACAVTGARPPEEDN